MNRSFPGRKEPAFQETRRPGPGGSLLAALQPWTPPERPQSTAMPKLVVRMRTQVPGRAWPVHIAAELGWETRLLVLGSSPLSGWIPLFLGNGPKMALTSKEVPTKFLELALRIWGGHRRVGAHLEVALVMTL